jgi:Protein of unknown function (DUF4238)
VATDPERQRQHLVSRGYQQNFADDHRVAVLDARSGATLDPRRPTRSNWRVDDFLTVVDPTGHRDDSLERDFAKTERTTLGQIRDIKRPRISLEQRRALDRLAAVHLVRSESFVAVHGQVTDAFFDNWPGNYLRTRDRDWRKYSYLIAAGNRNQASWQPLLTRWPASSRQAQI